ncbi:phage GP46 family protein [Variovorax paradoxus]|uniref:phage GP46 family protein n=1 Tax=Variovorax paradoxus TaxID=34073 RepID=UPI001E49A9F6|nr:phage GP46 family protein [Variovorax paradoxus]
MATRPQPALSASAVLRVPFDWRLTAPGPAQSFSFTDYSSGVPVVLDAEVLQVYALELEDTLSTAVILSLFSDRRAGPDDVLPLHQQDRRGWVGDEFMGDGFDSRVDPIGSLLWLCYVTKTVTDVLERARFAVQEALAWMIRDGIASRVEVTTEWAGPQLSRLAVRPTIYKPGQVEPVYDVLWATSLRKGGA